jgi:hypothetical protein
LLKTRIPLCAITETKLRFASKLINEVIQSVVAFNIAVWPICCP